MSIKKFDLLLVFISLFIIACYYLFFFDLFFQRLIFLCKLSRACSYLFVLNDHLCLCFLTRLFVIVH